MFSKELLKSFVADESGQNLIEFGLIAVFIGVACIASMKSLDSSIITLFQALGNKFNAM